MWWSCHALQALKSHEKSSDLSECHVSLLVPAQHAQHDKFGSPDSKCKAEGADKAPQALAARRVLAHVPSGKGSSSLDQIIPELHTSPADSDGNITRSAGTERHSVGAVHSAGAVTQSLGGATNDSSQACSNGHLAQDGKATAMAQLAEAAAAAMCSEEKASQAQQAGQQCEGTISQSGNKFEIAITGQLLVHRRTVLSALHAEPAFNPAAEVVLPTTLTRLTGSK